MRGGLPLDGGVQRQDHFGDIFTANAINKFRDPQFIGPDRIQRREASAQNVVAAFENLRPLHRPEIGDILHHAKFPRGAPLVATNIANIFGPNIAAVQTFLRGYRNRLHQIGKRG